MAGKDVASNKRALRDFQITETFEAGVVLRGTEVKSVRAGKASITESFARIERGECWLYGCDIQPWQTAGAFFQHEGKRPRKLLMHKKEILKLSQATLQKGFTLICLKMYFKGQKVKVKLGLGKGKGHSDQRQDLKKRTELREAQREVAKFYKGKGLRG